MRDQIEMLIEMIEVINDEYGDRMTLALASIIRKLYLSLVKAGFTSEEAIQIVVPMAAKGFTASAG